jgi:ankyrin repeat protein
MLEDRASTEPAPLERLEQVEMKERIWEALEILPKQERSATLLYYLSGYSQQEVARFLDVPVTTIKKRLFNARQRLRESLMDIMEDSLRACRPSRDERFASRVIDLLKAARAGDLAKVKVLLESDRRLLAARDPFGNTALICAVNSGHKEVAELLFIAGVRPDIYEAAAIGHTKGVAEWLRRDPGLLDSFSPEGFTALALAGHFGHLETAEFLLSRGADVNRVSKHPIQVAPLHAALFGRRIEMAKLLVARGADVRIRRGGTPWPRAGWTALHYAASLGSADLVALLIDSGAELNIRDAEGKTPLSIAAGARHPHVDEILRQHGATE